MSIQELEAAARALPLDQARHLQRVLDERLGEDAGGDGAPLPKKTPKEYEPVPYERIAHLAGIVSSGRGDLASNKEYLRDLGKNSLS